MISSSWKKSLKTPRLWRFCALKVFFPAVNAGNGRWFKNNGILLICFFKKARGKNMKIHIHHILWAWNTPTKKRCPRVDGATFRHVRWSSRISWEFLDRGLMKSGRGGMSHPFLSIGLLSPVQRKHPDAKSLEKKTCLCFLFGKNNL